MTRELADEAVVAIGAVDAGQPALLAHPEQEAIDRGPATSRKSGIELGHHVLGGEGGLAVADPVQYGHSRLGDPVPLAPELTEDRLDPLRTRHAVVGVGIAGGAGEIGHRTTSQARCWSSGAISFSQARRTAAFEPGVEMTS
jgi:hypothetical protein